MVVKEFPLYIDCTGPFNKDDYQLEYLFSNYWGEWQGEYTKYISEDWFYDCAEDYFLEYVPEEGGWLGRTLLCRLYERCLTHTWLA